MTALEKQVSELAKIVAITDNNVSSLTDDVKQLTGDIKTGFYSKQYNYLKHEVDNHVKKYQDALDSLSPVFFLLKYPKLAITTIFVYNVIYLFFVYMYVSGVVK